jgi:hypothetical protein
VRIVKPTLCKSFLHHCQKKLSFMVENVSIIMYYSTRYSQTSKPHRPLPVLCLSSFVLSCINDLIDMSNNTANTLYQKC